MALFSTLTLFPAYSLDTSILAAVLVGVLILALLTETFGWVFVGLVVPGYLASVFVIHPEAGVTVVAEAMLTYALALALSAGMSRTGAWSEFFGRDRFFAIVLSSVLVRALSEAVLLPHFGRWLDAQWGTSFALDRSLHSIGLVLVPLTANAFWKLKLRRGLWQVGVPVVLTYALLRFVLLPATNLSFSSLELMYEDVAQDFLASPKAYIILLTTALLAARFNLNYGWDFNGILVPALLALTWLEPAKLVATLLEVLLLVGGTRALLAMPGLRTLNLEGPRKTVLVFFLGFVVKWGIGWALGGRVPGLKVTDLFGFGYLVPTLLAVKILQKQAVARVMLATVHTSLAGFVVGSLVGFGLSLVEPRPATALTAETLTARAPGLGLDKSPLGVMALAHATARENDASGVPLRRRNGELRQYVALWRAAGAWLESGDLEAERTVRERAQALGLELRPLATPPGAPARFALVERERLEGKLGWDTAVLVPGAPGPVLEVPRPLTEAPSAEAAATLCERVRCRAIIASGVDTSAAGLVTGDALNEPDAPLRSAHVALSASERVQVRADTSLARGGALLHVPGGQTPESLKSLWPGTATTDAAPPEPGLSWGEARLSVLRAHPHDLATVALEGLPELPAPLTQVQVRSALLSPEESAPYAEGAAPQPTDAELLVLEQQVAAPLLGNGGATVPESLHARWASAMAGLMGMVVRPVEDCADTGPCWWVTDTEGNFGRAGASLLVRPGTGTLAFGVPVPDREQGTLAVALEAWHEARARALVVATPEGSTGALHAATQGHLRTTFQAFHQAVHRALPEGSGLVLQVRGFSGRPAVNADVLVDVGGPVLQPGQRPADLERLLAKSGPLGWLSSRVRYHDGSPELAGLSDASPQAAFSRTFGGAHTATLWLSEPLRGAFVGPRLVASELALAGLTRPVPAEDSPLQALLKPGLRVSSRPAPAALQERFAALTASAERYLLQQNVHELRMLARAGRAGPVTQSVRAGYSASHGLPWLVVEARQGRHVLRGVYFLQQHPSPLKRVELVAGVEGLEAAVDEALRHRRPVLLTGELTSVEGRR
ncbi:poly-gamma-glutamate biosynthesis protein PgsC/CapC [Pyxidicoccus trucidator]|uniref:poly-gamma-glutamate biosynthesis protein PgsC/CapC n=1 Tax=Pyxidicoccus trucidator TaxID=2709662 RepID=UPI0013DC3666|nr:poly-gamma-glutamate biosynthesis protein PgsC/CapC [Pyxidicoccus trucidator]